MLSPREGTPRGRLSPRGRRLALWVGLAAGWVVTSTGCQVEYAGMTLPSGKYMYDDVQYFPPGPTFPMANTHAATQRARMQAMGLDVGSATPLGPAVPPLAGGAAAPTQNVPNAPTNLNTLEEENLPPPPGGPGAVAPPGVPAPGLEPEDVPEPGGGLFPQ